MLLITVAYFWNGLTDTETETVWKWIDNGEAATFTDFHPTEPNRGTDENCVIMFFPFDYQWADYECNLLATPICEKR